MVKFTQLSILSSLSISLGVNRESSNVSMIEELRGNREEQKQEEKDVEAKKAALLSITQLK